MDNQSNTRDPLEHITVTFSKQVAELWHKLSLLGHEMFIAPGGQPLDPPLLFEVTGLDSTQSYAFSAVFEPVSNNKLEYYSGTGNWENSKCQAVLSSTLPSHSLKGFQTGAKWMEEGIDFQHLKIYTDVSSDEEWFQYGTRLRPFHRYALLINIYMLCPGVRPPIVTKTVKITDGEFIPVTEFHNPSTIFMKKSCPEEGNPSEMMNRKRIHQDDLNVGLLKKLPLTASVRNPMESGQCQPSSSTFSHFTATCSIQNPEFKWPKSVRLENLNTSTVPGEEVTSESKQQTSSVSEEQKMTVKDHFEKMFSSNPTIMKRILKRQKKARNDRRHRTSQSVNSEQIQLNILYPLDILWEELSGHRHEMLISPGGCSIQPPLKFKIVGLEQEENYEFSLHFESLNNSRNSYDFRKEMWKPTVYQEDVKCTTPIMHSKGMRTGKEWMDAEFDFQNLKLSTDEHPEDPNSVQLKLHYWYIPVITLYQVDSDIFKQFQIEYTQFITVENYHKQHVGDLKGIFKEPTATSSIKNAEKVTLEKPVLEPTCSTSVQNSERKVSVDLMSETSTHQKQIMKVNQSYSVLPTPLEKFSTSAVGQHQVPVASYPTDQFKIYFPMDLFTFFSELENEGNEMPMTPGGCYLYPCLKYNVIGLDPNQFYAFTLFFKADEFKKEYSYVKGWYNTGELEFFPISSLVEHPDGIMKGKDWMEKGISFEHVKIDCNKNPTDPDAVNLHPNHVYQPVVAVFLCNATNNKELLTTFNLTESRFIPVIHFHNPEMLELKGVNQVLFAND